MNPPESPKGQPRSHLFTVRLWREEIGGGAFEMRMQVKHVLSGETRYFRFWPDVERFLLLTVQRLESDSRQSDDDHL